MSKLKDINIIDIRNSQSYNNNHIENAINIPYNELIYNIKLDKNKTYYIYCQRGIVSQKACMYLNSLGYDTVNIIGGYEAWILKN